MNGGSADQARLILLQLSDWQRCRENRSEEANGMGDHRYID
jgi:hypothetical protein